MKKISEAKRIQLENEIGVLYERADKLKSLSEKLRILDKIMEIDLILDGE